MKRNAKDGRRIILPKHNAAWPILDMIVIILLIAWMDNFFSIVQQG